MHAVLLSIAIQMTTQHAHLAANIPNFCETPTVSSIADGDWMDPAIWSTGVVPGADDVVMVDHMVMICDDCDAVCMSLGVMMKLTIEGGLRVKDLLVYATGTLTLKDGCEIIIRDIPTDPTLDPEQFGTGVLVLGTLTANGQIKAPFVSATATIAKGESVVSITGDTTNWNAGDLLVVADSDQLNHDSSEPVILAAAGAGSVAFNVPVAFEHSAAFNADGNFIGGCPIINLTRSIVIRSENPAGTRGHVLATGTADVMLIGVQFLDLGRTKMLGFGNVVFNSDGSVKSLPVSQAGRYPLHMHHVAGPGGLGLYTFTIMGCSIDSGDVDIDLRWGGIVVHQSHFGLVANNAVWGKSFDGNIVTEDGNETGNTFSGNIAGGGRVGYFFYGFENATVVGNVGVACTNYTGSSLTKRDGQAFALGWGDHRSGRGSPPQSLAVPDHRGQPKAEWPIRKYRDLSFARIDSNISIGSDEAVRPWFMCQRLAPYGAPGTIPLLIENHLALHCRTGLGTYYEGATVMTDFRCYGDPRYATKNANDIGANGKFIFFGDHSYGIINAARAEEETSFYDSVFHNMEVGIFSRLSGNAIKNANYIRGEFRCLIGIDRQLFCQQPAGVDTLIQDCTFGLPSANLAPGAGRVWIKARSGAPGVFGSRDSCVVRGLNGDPTDCFELYFLEQDPRYVMLATYQPGPIAYRGLTVQQVSDQFGIAPAGAVAPATAVTRANIIGLCNPIAP